MPDVLLDTTVFIDDHNRNPGVRGLVEAILNRSQRAFFSPVTVYELWLRAMAPDEEAHHLALLSVSTEAPFDANSARIMAHWLTTQPRSGRKRLLGDAVIAATAASLGATIYTRNPRDFLRFYPDVLAY